MSAHARARPCPRGVGGRGARKHTHTLRRRVPQMCHFPQAAARVEEMIAAEGNAKQAIIWRFATRPVATQPIAPPH